MIKIVPFKGLRYDKKKVDMKKIVCPPYDVINKKQRLGYKKESAHNIVRLILPEEKKSKIGYKKARKDLLNWIDKGILVKDDKPSLYIYSQEYKLGKKTIIRTGFFSLLGIDTKENKGVLPHENTFSKPMLDRVELMKVTKAHLSPIFLIYRDKKAKLAKKLTSITKSKKPDLNIYKESIKHKLWKVSDENVLAMAIKHLDKSLSFIADGHHRFKASVETMKYFDSKKIKTHCNGHRYTLAYFVSNEDKGLKILPTHRAVKELPCGFDIDYMKERLSKYFSIDAIKAKDKDVLLDRAFKNKKSAFVIYYKKRYFFICLKNKSVLKEMEPKKASYLSKTLDVSILHNLIFSKLLNVKEVVKKERNIYYYKSAIEFKKEIDTGSQALGVYMNACTMDDVVSLAVNGEKMPHKSTYFYPKPLTGVVIHKF